MGTLSFVQPWLLSGLLVLPLLWWLLRATPPAPRVQDFPAIGLLLGLQPTEPTASRTPWWLLLLRVLAATLAIVGLSGPVLNAPLLPAPGGPVLLVIDNGWAAAPDWSDRLRAAARAVAEAARPDAPLRLLATAPDADGAPPSFGPSMPVAALEARLAALRPMPWPPDRAASSVALAQAARGASSATRLIYVADGVAGDAQGDARFGAAMARLPRVSELRGGRPPQLLRPPTIGPDQLGLRAETLPGHAGPAVVRAVGAAGQTLAETGIVFDGAGAGAGTLVLPPDLRNRVTALRLGGASAAGVMLLDEQSRRRPVGLLSRASAADEPLTGALYYVRRALAANTDLHVGDVTALVAGGVSAIVAPDQVFADGAELAALTGWVRKGGVLIRFAGPNLAAAASPDPLLPVTLLAGDRALGGSMSWSRPAALAPFPATSPFAGLAVPDEVRIARQVLAQPGDTQADAGAGHADWATLADGTPLVTARRLGAGQLVLFHVTANAAWSNLPLSGLFPDMLRRLVALSAGVRAQAGQGLLTPRRALDGFGQLDTPGPAARPLDSAALARAPPGPLHPPGLYGPEDATVAFNLGGSLPPLGAAAPIAGAALTGLAGGAEARQVGPGLLAAAMLLLALDLLVTLRLRGLLGAVAAVLLLVLPHRHAAAAPDMSSLATHLAYVQTGDAQADGISRAGLHGLSEFVNQRTAAVLADPVAVDPSHDELSFYPLLYWPVIADEAVPDGATLARLDDYMQDGGIILFDTRDAGPAAEAALRRIGGALDIPALTQLTPRHVLAHSFYLLRDFPGRASGAPVWVARDEDRANDSVSPVILGNNDWAAAWATDADGGNLYDVAGGEAQRVLAYRFGVNLVIYALTGNYKADQVHVPDLLRRMGNGADGPDPSGPVP